MIRGQYLYNGDDLSTAFYVIEQAFEKVSNNDEALKLDQNDNDSIYVVVYTENKAVATGKLYKDKEKDRYYIDKIAVLKEERGKKYGDFVVRMLIDKAFQLGEKDIFIKTRMSDMLFFEKIGFSTIDEEFEEDGSCYIEMKISLGGLCKECQSCTKNKLD